MHPLHIGYSVSNWVDIQTDLIPCWTYFSFCSYEKVLIPISRFHRSQLILIFIVFKRIYNNISVLIKLDMVLEITLALLG